MNAGAFTNMLERPTKIYSSSWAAGPYAEVNIDPWVLFLNDPLISSIVYRYKALRGDLQLKIQINGTPFHYGMLVAAYQPGYNQSRKISGNTLALTTCPHVLINPATSNVGKITCPMATPLTYVDLTTTRPSLGTLSIASLVDLASASGTVDTITLNIYAHLSNPSLSLPLVRDTPRVYVAQMGKKNKGGSSEVAQAAESGFISGPLKLASRWAGYLTNVPTIGPYATAASSFAGHAADFAKFFGYSRPRDFSAPSKILKSIAGNFANTDGVDTSVSLAVTEGQSLTIDPRVFGVPDGLDELAISEIAGKWSCVSSTEWTVGSSPNTSLVSENISPRFGVPITLPGAKMSVLTPLYFASLPFEFWSGTIEVKVQVVASKYHRGRLRIQWAPDGIFDNDSAINTSFSNIIEISDQIDHVFQIPYAQALGYSRIPNADSGEFAGNGTFRIVVQNELTSPEAVNSAHILLWVRGGADYKLASPSPHLTQLSNYTPQMGDVGISDTDVTTQVHSFFDAQSFPQFNDVYMADPIVSFRPMLKRFSHSVTLQPSLPPGSPLDNTLAMNMFNVPMYPLDPGEVPYASGWAHTTSASVLNANTSTLFNHLGNAFLGKRGSYRWKIAVDIPNNVRTQVHVCRNSISNISYLRLKKDTDPFNYTNMDMGLNAVITSTGYNSFQGMQYQHDKTNGNKLVEFEVPFYSNFKFVTESQGYDLEQGCNAEQGFTVLVNTHLEAASTEESQIALRCYAAAGEDFSMGLWRGIDPMYVYERRDTLTGILFVDDYN